MPDSLVLVFSLLIVAVVVVPLALVTRRMDKEAKQRTRAAWLAGQAAREIEPEVDEMPIPMPVPELIQVRQPIELPEPLYVAPAPAFHTLHFPNRPVMPRIDVQFVDEPLPQLVMPPVEPAVQVVKPVEPARPRRKDVKFCIGTVDGKPLYYPMGMMFLVRRTGGGKSNIVAIKIGQAIEQGVDVWFSAVSYKPVDEDGVDISPLIDRCVRVAVNPTGVEQLQLLRDAVELINERTIAAQEQRVSFFPPILLVAEELKALQSKLNLLQKLKSPGFENAVDESGALMEIILSTGRAYNVNILLVAQDGQSQTVKMSQGTLNNCEVRIAHPSLDRASLANLLPRNYDMKANPLPVPTTPYQWFVVSENEFGSEELVMVDVPRITNESIARYVAGKPLIVREKPAQPATEAPSVSVSAPVHMRPLQETGANITPAQGAAEALSFKLTPKHLQVVAYLTQHPDANQTEVAQAVWGRSDGSYSTRARDYMNQVRQHLLVTVTPSQDSPANLTPHSNAESEE